MSTRYRFLFTCAILLGIALLGFPGCKGGSGGGGSGGGGSGGGESGTPEFVSLGTAQIGGAFYSVGAAISTALNEGKEAGGWRKATAEATGGSLENYRLLESGDIQIGMANSSISYFAVRGKGGFDKKYDVQSIMTMFPLIGMFVTKEGSGIESLADMKGKRIVVGPEGAGFEYFLRPVLEAHGVTYDDFEPVYAGFSTSVGYLQDDSVAATFLGGGRVSPAITSAASTMDILLIPYDETQRQNLVKDYPSFSDVTVAAGTYKGQDADFPGLNVGSAHLLVRSDADEDFVYKATKAIFDHRAKIAEAHAAGKAITEKNVVRHVGTDFHAGAIRYYKEIGIWPDDQADGS
jgi:TRAP transporter TAXI family solute receptor